MSATRVVLILCVAEALGMLGVFALPAMLPLLIGEWSLSHTDGGWLNGIFFGAYAFGVPVLASLTDRIDARRVYLGGLLLSALSSLGLAVLGDGFWSALGFRALGGVGLAGTFIPGLKALADRFEGAIRARAVAFYTASFSLGTALSFFAAGAIGEALGWRAAYLAAALAAVLAGVLAALVLRPDPPPPAARPHLLDFRPVFANRAAMAYILAYAAHMWELFAMRSWLVVFLAFSLSLQADAEGFWRPHTVAAVTGLVAMWASIGGSELAQRFGRRRVLRAIMACSALAAAGIGFSAALPYPLVALLCTLYVMLVQADSAALHNGTVIAAGVGQRGTTLAVQSLLGFAAAFCGPLATGWLLDLSGGGASVQSWGLAFLSMGLVVGLGPLLLRLAGPARADE